MSDAHVKGRRKAITKDQKIAAALWQLGFEVHEVEWDHDPALGLRKWDEAAGDFIPPQGSPKHITVRLIDAHDKKTNGTKATSAGSDKSRIAKVARLRKEPIGGDAFVSNLQRRKLYEDLPVSTVPKRRIPSRPFSSRKGRK
jgi:hypothetical protein